MENQEMNRKLSERSEFDVDDSRKQSFQSRWFSWLRNILPCSGRTDERARKSKKYVEQPFEEIEEHEIVALNDSNPEEDNKDGSISDDEDKFAKYHFSKQVLLPTPIIPFNLAYTSETWIYDYLNDESFRKYVILPEDSEEYNFALECAKLRNAGRLEMEDMRNINIIEIEESSESAEDSGVYDSAPSNESD